MLVRLATMYKKINWAEVNLYIDFSFYDLFIIYIDKVILLLFNKMLFILWLIKMLQNQ